MKNINELVSYTFGVRNQAHLYHFQTTSYAEHMALDAFYTGMLDQLDELVELYQANHDKIELNSAYPSLANYTDSQAVQDLIADYVMQIQEMKNHLSGDDIHGILDDMIGLGNKTRYLLSLS
jgi:glucokinase